MKQNLTRVKLHGILTAAILFLTLFSLMFVTGCYTAPVTTPVYYELQREIRSADAYQKYISQTVNYFRGKKFFLDPGHGGKDRHNTGHNKLVIEADINLYVALYLRSFLTDAGAVVMMSRDKDTSVELADRSLLANNSGADFFISIHHNAPGSNNDTDINYTSTYYHALETDFEYEPMERDLARFIQRDLSYGMRNSGGAGSFDGTYSDYFIYPKKGFAVLRATTIPAVLTECAFFTNPYEERRLAIDEFNKIEAFGIFKGIYRYLRAGYPVIALRTSDFINNGLTAVFSITDSLGIKNNSIKVFVNEKPFDTFTYNNSANLLYVDIPYTNENEIAVRIIAQNSNGNSSLPFSRIFNTPKQ
jgi:N-acetylmuramoyl-L-alanine amidase